MFTLGTLLLLCTTVHSLSTTPEQVHLAYAGRDPHTGYPTGMTVSWATEGMPAAKPAVYYGTSSGQHDSKVVAETVTYFDTYFHHHATLDNLPLETEFFFVLGDEVVKEQTKEFTFTTSKKNSNIRVAVIGDMGIYNSAGTMAALTKVAPTVDFVWHVGDISYADDAFLHHLTFFYETVWNQYMNEVQNFTAYRPYMVLPGNHEAECHSPACDLGGRVSKLANFSAYNHRFRMPSDVSNGVMNMWYSFNVGPVHFVNIDTETDYPGAPNDHYSIGGGNGGFGDQLAWLEADLKQAEQERHLRPFVVVAGHRPVYSVTTVDKNGRPSGAALTLQNAVEGLFSKYHVDMYICGHIHGYERHQPIFNSTITDDCTSECTDPSSTIHIVDGSGGNTEGLTAYTGAPPKWNVKTDFSHFGYAIFETSSSDSKNSLKWQFFDDNEVLVDSFTVSKTSQSRLVNNDIDLDLTYY